MNVHRFFIVSGSILLALSRLDARLEDLAAFEKEEQLIREGAQYQGQQGPYLSPFHAEQQRTDLEEVAQLEVRDAENDLNKYAADMPIQQRRYQKAVGTAALLEALYPLGVALPEYKQVSHGAEQAGEQFQDALEHHTD